MCKDPETDVFKEQEKGWCSGSRMNKGRTGDDRVSEIDGSPEQVETYRLCLYHEYDGKSLLGFEQRSNILRPVLKGSLWILN